MSILKGIETITEHLNNRTKHTTFSEHFTSLHILSICRLLVHGPAIKLFGPSPHSSTIVSQTSMFYHNREVFWRAIYPHHCQQHLRKGLIQFETNCCHCIVKIRFSWNTHWCIHISQNLSMWKNCGNIEVP